MSTGMASFNEIKNALNKIKKKLSKKNIALLKCTSSYPAPFHDSNLRTIIDIVNNPTRATELKDLKEELKINRELIKRGDPGFKIEYEEKAKNYDPFLLDELPTDEDKLYTGEHVQTYLNRCYELEKLYLVKHQEFLYLKNVFDKSFIFYLMTFIVFFYYIKSLGIEEVKECRDLKVKIPKTFLGDIQLMVKNQRSILYKNKKYQYLRQTKLQNNYSTLIET